MPKLRVLRVIVAILLALVLLALSVPAANILSGHRLYFWANAHVGLLGSEQLLSSRNSSDGKYKVWLTRDVWLERVYTVYVTRWHSLRPKPIFQVCEERARVATLGPLKEGLDSSLAWSKDGHCIAFIRYGWYAGLYDFGEKKYYPMPVPLRGNADMAAWQKYHEQVSKRMNVK